MHHEHHGDCCQPAAAHAHEQHEHHRMAMPLGHVCTGVCMHEAAEAQAFAVLDDQRAMIQHLQSGTLGGAKEKAPAYKKDKKTKKKRQRLGILGLASVATA